MITVDVTSAAATATDPMGADSSAIVSTRGETNVDSDGSGGRRIAAVLAALRHHLDTDCATNIGFPSTFDFDYKLLWPFLNNVLNNVGDPHTKSAFPANTKHLEREVIEFFARLLRASADCRG